MLQPGHDRHEQKVGRLLATRTLAEQRSRQDPRIVAAALVGQCLRDLARQLRLPQEGRGRTTEDGEIGGIRRATQASHEHGDEHHDVAGKRDPHGVGRVVAVQTVGARSKAKGQSSRDEPRGDLNGDRGLARTGGAKQDAGRVERPHPRAQLVLGDATGHRRGHADVQRDGSRKLTASKLAQQPDLAGESLRSL